MTGRGADGDVTVSRRRRQTDEVAELLHRVTLQKPPTLGGRRLVCVDGRAGAGKTTLGQALLRAAGGGHGDDGDDGGARLLHMDDMYEGWDGLGDVSARLERDLITPLRAGRAGGYRRFDWHQQRFAEWRTVQPVDLLVLEGVGSGAARYADAITTLVWVDAPRELRLRRGRERDGDEVLPRWLAWMDSEEELFARERTRERSDVVVDGTGAAEHAVVFA